MRADLLGLTADSLAALTNRGLVKRAGKEAAPELRTDDDGTVHGGFPDGVTTAVPTGGLDAARCTCGSAGVCRHVIGVILAYQRLPAEAAPVSVEDVVPVEAAAEPSPPPPPWSPGQVTDDELTARIGARLMAAARRTERTGFTARVRRATAGDPVPQVELATATVRFLVPGDLGFVHTDAVAGSRDDVIALAVWAFRVADALHPGAEEARVDVGGAPGPGAGSGLERALGLAGTVLREGAAHLGQGLDAAIADVRRHLDAAGLRWPLLAVTDLAEQLASYRDRSSHYRPELLASHLAELHARHRAVTRPDATLRSSVLGTAEAAETPLRRARLDGLGCRIRTLGDQRISEVYLAHGDSAMVLVLRRRWDGDDDGAALARRRIAASTLADLATGTVVTESAVRSASRTVRLATGRISKTTVSASRGAWDELPPSLLVTDLAALGRELDALPLRPIRPRVEAELVRVVAVARVVSVTYAPGDQRLDAVIADRAGNTATVRATHTGAAPGRLDSLAAVLAGEEGEPRFVSGVVGRTAGGVVIEPLGLSAGGRVVVPDLRPPGGSGRLAVAEDHRHEPLTAALIDTRGLLAEAAHHGLSHLPPTYDDRLAAAARRLTVLGLHRVARAVTAFAAARADTGDETAERAWVDAYLRLDVALDLH
ncbi:SWIM zinc finger family protein [Microbispora sp. H10949]|uniref:SWIM zinc finger family protein n=1 Tax=Microbispora sp. H10949 TaxID=2729111 RepID=UPI0015FFD0A4|nr:SWIM zinc finger family protein [Microbispora sp. H10949]